jgi:glycosyltransferase involved in cell wall biosynthesis
VMRYAAGATIGIAPIENTCLNHTYDLPNKLFEYIQANLPVIATDLPEMRRLISEFGVGEIFPEGDATALASVIKRMLDCPQLLARYRKASRKAAAVLNWQVEESRLIQVYDRLKTDTPKRVPEVSTIPSGSA